MRKRIPSKRNGLSIAIMMASTGLAFPVVAQDDDSGIEEVVVTGSYIRGTPLDAPSPVQVVDRESIEAQGAAVIWDVIKNLEINSGSITNNGVGGENNGVTSQLEGTANVNLRNLGENSTLTLINGKRMAPAGATTRSGGEFVDLNSIPLVMTERVEILTDGGSALYGADAVAGVVNIIMRNDFEGLELYGDLQGLDSISGRYDTTVSGIWGWESSDGRTNFVLSGERFERDPVPVTAGNFYDENSEFLGTVGVAGTLVEPPTFGSNVSPGWYNADVVAYNVATGGPADPVYTDPGCYTFPAADGSALQIGQTRDERGERNGTCREDTSQYQYIANEMERNSFAASFGHSFSESAELYAFGHYSDATTVRADDGFNQSRGPTVFLAQPGAYTRNPAFGGNAIGQTMELGFFAPEAGNARPTEADIPNAPISGANGGPNVAMYQNVRDGLPRMPNDTNTTWTNSSSAQLGMRGDFDVGDRAYNYDVSYSFSQSSLEAKYRTFARDRAELAANGLGGPNCTPNGRPDFDFVGEPGPFGGAVPQAWDFYAPGLVQTFFPGFVFTTRESLSYALTSTNQGQDGCMFYNPFLTAQTDSSLANSQELMDWMNQEVLRTDKRNRLGVFDAVVSGELFDMTGGTAQFALGGQYRERNTLSRANELNVPGLQDRILGYDANGVPNEFHYVSNNFECSLCAFNYDDDRTTTAVFGELSLPFANNVESQIAVRWEDYGGNIGDAISPKFAVSWRPIETLLLRGSYSQSFRAPNIAIVRQGLESSETTFRDPISNQEVRAGLVPPIDDFAEEETTYTLGNPAPNVGNEYADTFGLGFIWTPDGRLDGLHVQADYWRFEVEDRVLPEPPIRALQPEIDAFSAAAADPNNYVLNDTIPADSDNPYTACDPAAIEAQFGRDSDERLNCVVDPRTYVVSGVQRAFGVSDANLITLTLGAINAGRIEADGVDIRLGYTWANDLGNWRASIDYTHVNQYTLIDVPGLARGLKDTGEYDAAGTTGDNNLVRSLPDNKGNFTLGWSNGSHSATAINRHVGSYQDLDYDTAYATANDFVRTLLRRKIDSYNTWDLQYNYMHEWDNVNMGATRFSVGLLDAFNADLPYYEQAPLNFDASVFDGRGRRFYVRALWQF
ncbi:MAG: TonB-dependent receptor [Gammaproteobacteria bacterium]